MARPSIMPRMDGFTLLEIMVALAIFATLATAVLSASQYVVKQAAVVEERLMAAWVADNRLNELRLQSTPAIGPQQRLVHMDRRDWVVRQRARNGSDPRLLEVDVEVSLAGREQVLHRASGWIPIAMNRQAGFTLLELVIALAIFALLGLASWTLFDGVVRVQRSTMTHEGEFRRLQRAVAVIERDLLHVTEQPIMLEQTQLQLQRGNWRNPLDQAAQRTPSADLSPRQRRVVA